MEKDDLARRVAHVMQGRPDLVKGWLSNYDGNQNEMRNLIYKYWDKNHELLKLSREEEI